MEPLKWSVYFQNPEFMELTRMTLILPEYEPLVRKWCGICDGAQILDVGCGTGYFTRLLARGPESACFTGIDMEDGFIERAKELAEAEGLAISFLEGDALHLPFTDASFDVAVSHTFLTSVTDPQGAVAEMKRVVKPGGLIASVTCMNFLPQVFTPGEYPSDCTWYKEFQELTLTLNQAYEKINPLAGYAGGVRPDLVPGFLAKQGLQEVSAYPIGKLVSLSNAAMSHTEKERYIDLYQSSELKKLHAYMELPQMKPHFCAAQAERYEELLNEKCRFLRSDLDENRIWEWTGGANVLITGRTKD